MIILCLSIFLDVNNLLIDDEDNFNVLGFKWHAKIRFQINLVN